MRVEDSSLVLIQIMEVGQFAFQIPDPFQLKFDVLVDNSERVKVQVNEDFAKYILNMYKDRLKRAIQLQRFPVQYVPLSPKYVGFKRKKGWNTGFWKATGYLQRNLHVWVDSGNYNIGFKAYQIHPVHKKAYSMICMELEYGNPQLGIPSRPLFTPIAERLEQELPQLFEQFLLKNFSRYKQYMIHEEQVREQGVDLKEHVLSSDPDKGIF